MNQQALHQRDEAGSLDKTDGERYSAVWLLMTVAATGTIFYILTFYAYKHLRMRSLAVREQDQFSNAGRNSNNTYPAWVGASVPRQVGGSYISLPAEDPSTLRRRFLRNTNDVVNDNDKEESEWIASGVSAINHGLQRTSQTIRGTSNDEFTHHESISPQRESPAEANEPSSLEDNIPIMGLDDPFSPVLTGYSDDKALGHSVLPLSWQSNFQAPEQPAVTSMDATSNATESRPLKTGEFSFSNRIQAPESLHKYTHSEKIFYGRGVDKDSYRRSKPKNSELFSQMLDQYNELQQQRLLENMEMKKAQASEKPLESMTTRDYPRS